MGNRNISGRARFQPPPNLQENFFHQHEPEHTCWESAWESLRVMPLPLSQVKRVSDACCMCVLGKNPLLHAWFLPLSIIGQERRHATSTEVAQRGGRARVGGKDGLGGLCLTGGPLQAAFPSPDFQPSHGPSRAEGLSSCLEEGLDKQRAGDGLMG